MTGPLRLFLAIEAPPAVAVAIEGMIEALGWTGLSGLRPVRPEGVHLTLRFLGGVERGRVGEIVDTVAGAVSGVAAFEASDLSTRRVPQARAAQGAVGRAGR